MLKPFTFFAAKVVLTVSILVSSSFANIIRSGDFNETCMYGPDLSGTGQCNIQTILPFAGVYQEYDPLGNGATWISYANTGAGGNVGAPSPDGWQYYPREDEFLIRVTENVYAQQGQSLHIAIWADDTARVWIDGFIMHPANFKVDFFCADGPIGCEPLDQGVVDYNFLTTGIHTIDIDVYNFHSPCESPACGQLFGVMYSGSISPISPIPEPSTFHLVIVGLGLVTWLMWRSSTKMN